MLVALCAGQHRLALLDKSLPPRRIGPAEELLGFLPGQLQTVSGRTDGLAAAPDREVLAHPADEAAQGPAWRRIGPGYGRGCGRALGGAEAFAELGLMARTKRSHGVDGSPGPVS